MERLKNDPTQNPSPGPSRESPLDEFLQILKSQRRLVLVLGALSAGGAFLHHIFMPTYPARTTLVIQDSDNSPLQSTLAKMGAASALMGKSAAESSDKYALFMNTHEFAVDLAREIRTKPEYEKLKNSLEPNRNSFSYKLGGFIFERLVQPTEDETQNEELARAIERVTQVKKNGADEITIRVATRNPALSVELANAVADIGIARITKEDLSEISKAKHYIVNQIDTISQKLNDFDSQMVELKTKNRIISPELARSEVGTRSSVLEREIDETSLKFEQNQKMIGDLTKDLEEQDKQLLTGGARSLGGANNTRVRQQIESLKYKKSLMQAQGYTEDSPQILSINDEMENAASRLKILIEKGASYEPGMDNKDDAIKTLAGLKKENQFLSAKLSSLKNSLVETRAKLTGLPKSEQAMFDLRRKGEMEFGIYQELKKRLLEIEVNELSWETKVKIAERATAAAIMPRLNALPKMFVAALLGMFFGAILIFGLEELSTSIKTREEFEAPGFTLIGSIPDIRFPLRQSLDQLLTRKKPLLGPLVLIDNAGSAESIAFRSLRTNVLSLRPGGQPVKVIAVLSPSSGEGRSFLASNLAVAIADLKKKVLLVDFDPQKATSQEPQAKGPGVPPATQESRKKIIENVATGVDMLLLGKYIADAAELINGGKFQTLIDTATEHYDVIVIDTPPLLAGAESALIANLADTLLLTVTCRMTRRENFQIAAERLTETNKSVVYTVFNRVNSKAEYIRIYLQKGLRLFQSQGNADNSELRKTG